MKKSIYLLLILTMFSLFTFGQSQRLVLLEHFTQASCGPCATWNPTINNLINANPDKITAIKYHVSWPGYDPMNNHNPGDPATRVGYYGVSSVPRSVLDGNYFNGSPSGWNINTVNNRYAIPSPFEIQLYQQISPDEDSVYVTMLIKATDNVSGTLVAFMGVVEKHIHFAYPPGSNGEKDFYHVLKKLLPKNSGAGIPSSFEPDDYVILQSSWEFANVYNIDEIATVGFVQNKNTKEVHQAVNSSNSQVIPFYSNDAEIIEIRNISRHNCLGYVDPKIVIRNNGLADLTSLDIHYTVNNGEPATYQWSGNLGSIDTELVTLNQICFDVQDDNDLKIYSSNPNGVPDDYGKNDTIHKSFMKAYISSNTVTVVIITDDFPDETTWEITGSEGNVAFSGGPYAEPGHVYQENCNITENDCYKFTVYDAGGNGMCCEYGMGVWGVLDGNYEIGKGGIFTYRDSVNFRVGPATGIVDNSRLQSSWSVFPNPSKGLTNLNLELKKEEFVRYQIVNLFGEIVKTKTIGNLMPGNYYFEIRFEELPPGIYFLNLQIGHNTYTEKLSMIK
ncbi:MAG: T9SS type A sorting domain-containing protein [Bacteroidales bacterium]|nr:T9SS type A sorting domain-containing protein [Bacteroidales bacterium]